MSGILDARRPGDNLDSPACTAPIVYVSAESRMEKLRTDSELALEGATSDNRDEGTGCRTRGGQTTHLNATARQNDVFFLHTVFPKDIMLRFVVLHFPWQVVSEIVQGDQ